MKTTSQCLLYAFLVSLFANIALAQDQQTPAKPQLNRQTVAYCVDATSGLNVKGTIIIDKLDKTPRYSGAPLPVKLIYASATTEQLGHGFAHTRYTNQIKEGLISDFLDNVPDLTIIRNRLLRKKPLDDSPPIASFTFYLVSKSEGDLLGFFNKTQQHLIFHEEEKTTSGLATVIFTPQYNISNIEHYKLFLSVLKQFSKLASDLDCQNIWVTVKMGKRIKYGICWKNSHQVIIQGPN